MKPLAFGLTTGIFWAVVVAWSVLMGILGKGTGAYDCISAFYLGLFSMSWLGLVIGTVIGFFDGFVFGLLFGWVYNKFAKK